MIERVGVFVKSLQRRDVISLAPGTRANALRLVDGTQSLLQLCGGRRRPDLVVAAHRDDPISHAAARVNRGYFVERLFGFFVFERMEPGYGAIKLLLGRRRT